MRNIIRTKNSDFFGEMAYTLTHGLQRSPLLAGDVSV